jgi:hypothetical protein
VATESEKLLEAEDAVRTLMANLTQLKEEVENYSAAGLALKKVRDDLHDLVTRTTDLAEATRAIIDTLGRIGTAELLERLQSLQAQAGEVHASVERTQAQASTLHASVERTQEEYRQFSVIQQEHGSKLDTLAEMAAREYQQFSAIQREHGAKLDTLAEKVDNSLAHIEGAVADRLTNTISRVERGVIALKKRQSMTAFLLALTLIVGLAILSLSFPLVRSAVGLP